MKYLTHSEVQKELREMLKDFIEILEKNNIPYFVEAGTCLGAIRHKGFIPWDNDIDIIIPRKEYEELLPNLNLPEKYKFFMPEDKNYLYPFIKFANKEITLIEECTINKFSKTNLYIDVFPLDYVPNDEQERNKKIKKAHIIKMLISMKGTHSKTKFKGFIKGVYRILFFWLPLNELKNKLNKMGESEKTDYRMVLTWGSELVKTIYFEDFEYKEFEGLQVRVPKMYHEYLTDMYGDYMQLPPVEKRITHDFKAYYEK